ncbi:MULTISPECIES: DUF262 domain-containing protein [Halomonas]|uniref:DUF262 domain-containing protein n=1 Tax=Halomonas TaxID=2745 RepID=UPI001C939003|nr:MULTISPECIES: DUF262 domain-containing protein [Halomonas]MBY6206873.1 DUF262 domain-containing protein [Halomonas sp. DP3Y7-2]MBY6230347.1 DUF262 domain-containing protein [Halomonas sp. DP3Y7-1]MCA0918508.1 DUF262 domain-containing protein [Halomonas denitrificans]
MSVTPRGMSVQEAYREYSDGNFRVNRQYQRKLVWTFEEKRRLIDSVLSGYPIPLILLATKVDEEGVKKYEIIDGMQRLNAVFSFMENKFDIEGKYFDIEQSARAKQVSEEGGFEVKGEMFGLLDAEQCANLLEYTFAITEFPAVDPDAVNEVFGRINAYGRQLSAQEKRQAGVISLFANTVREIASELRGDASSSFLDLSEMPQISIDVGGDDPDYGVRADNTFWCRQGILRRNQLREAEDEQFVADLVISILENEPFAFSGSLLDRYYDSEAEEYRRINAQLYSYGDDAIKNAVVSTFSIIRTVLESVDDSHNALRRIIHPSSGANPIKTGFYAVFMAFYDLVVRENKVPYDNHRIIESMSNLQDRLHVAAGQIRSGPREQNISATKGLIQNFFEEREPGSGLQGVGLVLRFENALRRSKVETSAYECKQGFVSLCHERNYNFDLLERLVKTVCGIANIGPQSSGAIFVGVSDDERQKNIIEELDGVNALSVGARFVVGVDRELGFSSLDLEGYKRRVVDYFASSSLSDSLKGDVLSTIDCIEYRGMSVLCIWVPSQDSVSTVDDVVFIRQGSSTVEVQGFSQQQAVVRRFS